MPDRWGKPDIPISTEAPDANEVLTFNAASGLYEPEPAASGGISDAIRLRRVANLPVVSGVPLAVPWEAGPTFERGTPGALWSPGQPTRLIGPAGIYELSVNLQFANNTNGYRYLYVYKNGAAGSGGHDTFLELNPVGTRPHYLVITDQIEKDADDYFEIFVFHNSTTTPLNMNGSSANFCNWKRIAA